MKWLKTNRPALIALAVFSVSACTPLSRTGEQPLSPEEIRMRAVETKVAEVNRRVLAVENKDESKTQDELRTLRGEIERLRFELDTQSRRNKDLGSDLERRLQRLESQPASSAPLGTVDGSGAAVPPVIYAPAAPAAPAAPSVSGDAAAEEQSAYLKAFDHLKSGRYDGAITGFKGMLEKWPQGNFAVNAWYWLGESQYVKRQYKPALESYTALIERFPASPKVPDAIFKSGLSQLELKQTAEAKASWRRVMKDYPNSNAAGLARQRLAQTQ